MSFWRQLVTLCYWMHFITCWSRASRIGRPRRTIIGSYPLCPLGCSSCSTMNGCVTCEPGHSLYLERSGYRQIGTCVLNCPRGYYSHDKKDLRLCWKCSLPNCKECTDALTCTSCQSPYIAHTGKCVDSCAAGLTYATYSKQCLKTVDCMLAPWSTWSVCTRNGQSCGYKYGIHHRTRDVLQTPTPDGRHCGVTSESDRCRLLYRYCSDILTNSSEPPRHPCAGSKKSRMCRAHRKRLRRKRKRCRLRRKLNRRKKKSGKPHRRRNDRCSKKSKLYRNIYIDVPNIKTNQIDSLAT